MADNEAIHLYVHAQTAIFCGDLKLYSGDYNFSIEFIFKKSYIEEIGLSEINKYISHIFSVPNTMLNLLIAKYISKTYISDVYLIALKQIHYIDTIPSILTIDCRKLDHHQNIVPVIIRCMNQDDLVITKPLKKCIFRSYLAESYETKKIIKSECEINALATII
jgi:hypothetical protein